MEYFTCFVFVNTFHMIIFGEEFTGRYHQDYKIKILRDDNAINIYLNEINILRLLTSCGSCIIPGHIIRRNMSEMFDDDIVNCVSEIRKPPNEKEEEEFMMRMLRSIIRSGEYDYDMGGKNEY